MSRYVDIDRPIFVRCVDDRSHEVVTTETTIAELLDETVEVLEEDIVRCKKCKHWTSIIGRNEANCGICRRWQAIDVTYKDFYCAGAGRINENE